MQNNKKMGNALANIITNAKKVNFDLPINKCVDMSCVDNSLPTLIIGYENAKKFINDFNILKKFYPKQNLRWTFKRTERAVDYEKDLIEFYEMVIENVCSKTQYKFINIVGLKYKTAKSIINFIRSNEKKMIFNENNRFLYVYGEKYNTVFGFSLSTANFFGIKPSKILKLFRKDGSNVFIDDFSNIPYNVKNIIGEKIDKYMVMFKYFT